MIVRIDICVSYLRNYNYILVKMSSKLIAFIYKNNMKFAIISLMKQSGEICKF